MPGMPRIDELPNNMVYRLHALMAEYGPNVVYDACAQLVNGWEDIDPNVNLPVPAAHPGWADPGAVDPVAHARLAGFPPGYVFGLDTEQANRREAGLAFGLLCGCAWNGGGAQCVIGVGCPTNGVHTTPESAEQFNGRAAVSVPGEWADAPPTSTEQERVYETRSPSDIWADEQERQQALSNARVQPGPFGLGDVPAVAIDPGTMDNVEAYEQWRAENGMPPSSSAEHIGPMGNR